jgi:uncharacterized protein
MEAVLRLDGLLGDTGPDHLREAVEVDGVHPATRLDLRTHLVRPRFGTEDPDLERRPGRVDADALHLVDDREEVRRGDHDDPRLEVDDELHLTLGHAAGDGNDRAAEPLRAVVRPEAAREEAVPVRDVDHVAAHAPGRRDRARHQLCPGLDVALRVSDDGRLAGRARRGVDPHDVLAGHGEHPERVARAQVVLRREREAGEVGEPPEIVGPDTGRVEGATVVRYAVVDPADGVPEPFELKHSKRLGRARGRHLRRPSLRLGVGVRKREWSYDRKVDVTPISGPESVMEQAGRLLLADEARHNLALGILSTARADPELYPVVQGWIAREAGEVVGAALRTPPYNLVVVRPSAAVAVEALAGAIDEELPGVVGAVPEVDAFVGSWSAQREVRPVTRFEQGIYAVTSVVGPPEPQGGMRLALPADRPLLLEWVEAFAADVLREGPERHAKSVDARLASDDAGFCLWEVDGRPVSLVGFGGPTPNGIRIGPVYTPPELRGHGFATALTARVSRMHLDRGRRFCFLYTDLANPTSNAIYARIGYERVCESREVVFTGA